MRRFIASYEPRTVRHDYAGFALLVRLEDPLGEGWYDRDWDEPAEISQLRGGRLRTGAAVFDIGAHQGIVALILARIVGERGRVIAVEAEPHNVRVARNNVAANEIRNVTILHAAVGATNGTLSFIESLNGRVAPRGRPGAIDVPATTVDALAVEYGHPDVVLIDVEGFEAHVLDGAAATLASRATDFFVELHSDLDLDAVDSTAHEVMRHFDERHFDVRVALADDTPPGLGSDQLLSSWEVAQSGGFEASGRRCFVVATARPVNR